ncbi:farnesylated protein 3 [Zea mays]|uniref:Farnesylated protein 3 n=1 Tax=Zea mays TaxID=4577 RepID=A0A1D6H8Y5_MAIZE|nr:farnesylated protein 3 [Zea mays]
MGEEEKAKEAAPPADKVKEAEEKKGEGGGGEEKKNEAPSLPPPPPEEVVMRVFMHCEGCARKVKKILKGFDGVEDVIADTMMAMLVMKGKTKTLAPLLTCICTTRGPII